MAEAKNGDTVKIHYTGKLDDGSVFDSSADREPLEFTIGEGNIIPGFEQAVLGMAPGDSKTINIAPDDAYGPYREEMLQQVERASIPEDIPLELGAQLSVVGQDDQQFVVTVVELDEEHVTLDANHPLAGEPLTFDIQLVEIV